MNLGGGIHRLTHLLSRVRDRFFFTTITGNERRGREPSAARIRMAFIAVAFPLFAIASFFFVLVLAHPDAIVTERARHSVNLVERFRSVILDHRSISLFLSATFAGLQLLAIIAAIQSWESILFAYVVITGILGMIVGIVGTSGLILSYLFMPHSSGLVTLITIILVFTFLTVFYLLTVLGLKVMSHLRRHHGLGLSSRSRDHIENEHGAFENIAIDTEDDYDDQLSMKIITSDNHNYYI